ncbi:FecR family protein [Chitinophaga japonensis]|uniref:FecR family protein n=1 Tax=Chitinophaga japonensis TaxID=104662 RepID=A0A562T4Z3_CHIJA|nr:FecR family protein [Chitinophaga japonensis]TWI88443.1 FecR family protein [Chitinophaga japonensis]
MIKDYRLFDITDFVLDEDFIRWVHEQREEDELFWNDWLRRHPGKHLVIAEARRILESLTTSQEPVPAEVVAHEVDRLLQTIRDQQPAPALRRVRSRHTRRYAAAAVILLALAGIAYFALTRQAPIRQVSYAALTAHRQLVENVNTSGSPIRLTLPDSSVIELAPDSRIAYAAGFDSARTRDVYLSGQAFFDVARMPNRPFRVFANDIVTKVLGTSFCIRSFENDTTIQVTVRTGKVSVYTNTSGRAGAENNAPGNPGEVILAPNQRLVYEKTAQKFQKVLLENPLMIVPAEVDRNMVYEEAPLKKVFDAIANAYDISIVYDEDLLQYCTVTADLRKEPFYRKLDLVCRAVGATYEVIEGQVVIQASGCN